jgi:glycosyltransferase involved in cell wall biosynthesis
MGAAGRRRAVEEFGWRAVAERTVTLYSSIVDMSG